MSVTKLAVFTPAIGLPSETFVCRHLHDLWPQHTVAISRLPPQPFWHADVPLLNLDSRPAPAKRIFEAALRQLKPGLSPHTRPVCAFLKAHNVSVIMGEYLDASLPWFQIARDLNIPFWAHAHGQDVSARLRQPAFREKYQAYRDAAGIITINEISKRRLIELGLDAAKIHIIPCGVDVPEHAPTPASNGDQVHCVAVGRMVAKKAPILLLDAFRRAAESNPQLHLDYAGGGELLPAARQFVHAFNLESRVSLHGPMAHDEVQALISRADIFLQHSMTDPDTGDEEGLPVAVQEAMAAGKAVVSTRHAGIPEAVVEGETGLLVDEGDSRAMAEAILELAHDANRRTQMGMAGWEQAREKLSWPREREALRRVMGLNAP